MIELSKHIEILLLKHNCVIVPRLGGFIAQDVPARYVAEENLFLPPHRTVAFNPQITLNDGLLMQSYMEVYKTNYADTLKMIDQAVSSLKLEIQENGEFEMNGIGKISINIEGLYVFEPYEAGMISPSLYGLDSVNVLKRNKKKKLTSKTNISDEGHDRNGRSYTIQINKELVNYVAAAIVSFFFYFIWATPITDSSSINSQQASMLFPHTIQYTKEKIPEYKYIDSKNNNIDLDIEMSTRTMEEQLKDSLNAHSYTIVLASRIPLTNAENYMKNLQKKGFEKVYILQTKKLTRVVYGNYSTEKEALIDLQKIRRANVLFKEAWIFQKSRY